MGSEARSEESAPRDLDASKVVPVIAFNSPPGDGIGSHGRFKISCRKACRFESYPGDQTKGKQMATAESDQYSGPIKVIQRPKPRILDPEEIHDLTKEELATKTKIIVGTSILLPAIVTLLVVTLGLVKYSFAILFLTIFLVIVTIALLDTKHDNLLCKKYNVKYLSRY